MESINKIAKIEIIMFVGREEGVIHNASSGTRKMSSSGSDNSSRGCGLVFVSSELFVFQIVGSGVGTMRKVIICSQPQFWRLAPALSDRRSLSQT